MKKALLILLASLLVSAPVFAQNTSIDPDKITYGVHGGLNFQKGVGFFVGGFAQLPFLMDDMYIQAGPELALRRTSYEDLRFRNLYLELPIHLGYNFFLSHEFSVFADAGPYVGVALARKCTSVALEGYEIDKCNINAFNIGLGLNVGVELMEAFRGFVGFDYGFIPVLKHEHARNYGLRIGVGYRF